MNVRFTTWLSETERDLLDKRAKEMGASVNFIVRTAIREYLGMDTPSSHLSQVTDEKVSAKQW